MPQEEDEPLQKADLDNDEPQSEKSEIAHAASRETTEPPTLCDRKGSEQEEHDNGPGHDQQADGKEESVGCVDRHCTADQGNGVIDAGGLEEKWPVVGDRREVPWMVGDQSV